jgi:hypothetical protein
MSVDLKRLKEAGCSSGEYKRIWNRPDSEYSPRQRALRDMISANIRDGIQMNLREHRAYYAVDLAYDAPFNQTTPTLVRNILDKGLDYPNTKRALESWGLSEDTLYLTIPLDDNRSGKVLNPPVFFNILIPIVKAYVTAILGQIFNDRNTKPLLQYKPLKETDRNNVLCEIQTDIVDTIATRYGYPAVLRQAIQQQLKYGVMLSFPREEWHCEKQEQEGGSLKTVKEGIRYILPHPARMFVDLEYPLTTFNTDTGCMFAGHWHAISYGSILDNRSYWNRKHIFAGTNWFASPLAGNYFSEVFPCRMDFLHTGYGPLNREDKAAWYNSTTDRQKMVFVTEYFHKIIPKSWDVGTYPYPVWHRFTVAGDDTIIWSAPCAYNPVWFMGYDYDEQASRTASLGLEIIPWQDHLGMILSQMLLSAKQNLLNVIFYDTNMVNKDDIDKFNNYGENRYRSTCFIPFDSLKTAISRLSIEKALIPLNFTKQSIQEMLQMLPTMLGIMERVLGISSQTAGSQGTHQQSKEEISVTSGSSQNRISLIASHTDEGVDAWMRQLHHGIQAYNDDEITAQVSSDIPDLDKHLEELGFKTHGESDSFVVVKGSKKAVMELEGFARTYRGADMAKDKETAQVIFSTVGTVAGQPDLLKEVGAKNLLKLIEYAAILGGAPRGFKLRMDPDAEKNGELPENIKAAIMQAQQATMQAVEQKIAQPIAQEMAGDKKQIQQIEAVLQKLEGIYKIAQQTQDKNAIKARESEAKLHLRGQEQAASERRKDQAATREQARKDHALVAELRRNNEELRAKLEAMHAELAAKMASEKVKSDSQAAAATKPAEPKE